MSGFAGDVFGSTSFVDQTYNGTRMEWVDVDEIQLVPYVGSFILVARQPHAASDFAPLLMTDDEMAGDGSSVGTPLPTNQRLYVYACTAVAAFPMTLAASSAAPTQVGADWYLGTTGEAINARFVGVVYPISGEFVDTESKRLVWNQWNRIQKSVFACPGYLDDGLTTTYNVTTAGYERMHGGTGDDVQYITGPVCGVLVGDTNTFAFTVTTNATAPERLKFGIGIDNTSDAYAVVFFEQNQLAATASLAIAVTAQNVWEYHRTFMIADTVSETVPVVADWEPSTGSHDPYATFLSGTVWC